MSCIYEVEAVKTSVAIPIKIETFMLLNLEESSWFFVKKHFSDLNFKASQLASFEKQVLTVHNTHASLIWLSWTLLWTLDFSAPNPQDGTQGIVTSLGIRLPTKLRCFICSFWNAANTHRSTLFSLEYCLKLGSSSIQRHSLSLAFRTLSIVLRERHVTVAHGPWSRKKDFVNSIAWFANIMNPFASRTQENHPLLINRNDFICSTIVLKDNIFLPFHQPRKHAALFKWLRSMSVQDTWFGALWICKSL